MGRWAQAKKRGSIGPVPGGFTIPPPIFGSQWQVNSESDTIFGQSIAACPEGADGVEFRLREVSTDPWTISESCGCIDSADGQGCLDGVDYEAQARWTLGGLAVSDWSPIAGNFTCIL